MRDPDEEEYPISTIPEQADALLAEYGPKRTCKVRDSGHADIVDALVAKGAGSRIIERILAEKFGTPISFNTVLKHTRHQCGCASG